MIVRNTANDYAITCEIEVDDATGAFIRLIRAWGVDPAYRDDERDEPELAITTEREQYAAQAWAQSYRARHWDVRASSPFPERPE